MGGIEGAERTNGGNGLECRLDSHLWDGKLLSERSRPDYRVNLGARQCPRLSRQMGFRPHGTPRGPIDWISWRLSPVVVGFRRSAVSLERLNMTNLRKAVSSRRPLCGWRSTLGAGAFAVAAFGSSCGDGGAPSAPVAMPPTSPVAPNVAGVTFLGIPGYDAGWRAGETIAVQVLFSETVSVAGSPRLALGIGSATRFAQFDEEASQGAFVVFRYGVTREDQDGDGVSVGENALILNGATIRNAAGLDADLNLGSYAVENAPAHLVIGVPPERGFTDEHKRAARFSPVLVSQWNGRPFRVDMLRNFPSFVTEADLLELLAPMGRLADRIEVQLGYPVIEMGAPIPVPAGAPPGWNEDWVRYWQETPLPIEPNQIAAFFLDDYSPYEWDGSGLGAPMNAHYTSGSVSYNKRFLGALWTGDDPCCRTGRNSRQGEAIVHEVFHVLGFAHSDDERPASGDGVAMTEQLTGYTHLPVYAADWADIDLLRCIFPEGG